MHLLIRYVCFDYFNYLVNENFGTPDILNLFLNCYSEILKVSNNLYAIYGLFFKKIDENNVNHV